MKSKWKVVIGILVLLLATGGVLGGIKYSRRNIVTVQTGKVVREDLAAVVTASGEVKPRNYINIGAEYQGQLTEILVKEGDHVRKGQLLARIDEAQSAADVEAQKAALSSAEADAAASEAGVNAGQDNINALQATLEHSKADLERFQTGLAVEAWREPLSYRLRRFGSRNAVLLWLLAAYAGIKFLLFFLRNL